MGEYDISQWRLAGTQIHTPSDPKMTRGVRTSFTMKVMFEPKEGTDQPIDGIDVLSHAEMG